MSCVLRVVKVRAPARIALGELRVIEAETVFGRDPTCGVVLDDPRVSRVHASFVPTDAGFTLIRLGAAPVYVDQRPVAERAEVRVGQHVQLGGVLLRVEAPGDPTLDPTGPMSLGASPPAAVSEAEVPDAAVLVRLDRDQQLAWLGDVALHLQPGPQRVLEILASRPGEWIGAERIAVELWGEHLGPRQVPYLSKYVSAVRAAFRPVLADDADLADRLAEAVARVDKDVAYDQDVAGLLRLVLQARKKVGFRLTLPADAVRQS